MLPVFVAARNTSYSMVWSGDMNVKVGDWVFGRVVGFNEYGIVIQPHNSNEEVFARTNEELKIGDVVQMEFKSYGVGCYWEAEYDGF